MHHGMCAVCSGVSSCDCTCFLVFFLSLKGRGSITGRVPMRTDGGVVSEALGGGITACRAPGSSEVLLSSLWDGGHPGPWVSHVVTLIHSTGLWSVSLTYTGALPEKAGEQTWGCAGTVFCFLWLAMVGSSCCCQSLASCQGLLDLEPLIISFWVMLLCCMFPC